MLQKLSLSAALVGAACVATTANSQDQRAIVLGGGVVQTYDLDSTPPVQLSQHATVGAGSEDVAITPDGRIAAIRAAGTVQFLATETGTILGQYGIPGGADGSDWIAITDSFAQVLGGGVCQTYWLFDLVPTLRAQNATVGGAAMDIEITPDQRTSVVRTAGAVQFRRSDGVVLLQAALPGTGAGSDLLAVTNSRAIVLGGGVMQIYDVSPTVPSLIAQHATVGSAGDDVAITPNGSIAVVRTGNGVQFVDLVAGTVIQQFGMPGPGDGADWVATTDTRAIVLGGTVAQIYDLTTPTPTRLSQSSIVSSSSHDVEITPNGQIAVVRAGGITKFFDLATGSTITQTGIAGGATGSDWVTTTNARAVVLGGGVVQVYDLQPATPTLLAQHSTTGSGSEDVEISSAGVAVVRSASTVQFLNLTTGAITGQFSSVGGATGSDWIAVGARQPDAPGESLGRASGYGAGCPNHWNMIYEVAPAGVFDLDGSSLTWTQNGQGSYLVTNAGAFLPFGSGTDTMSTNNAINGPWNLDFTFSYPGGTGSTTAVDLAPNGHVLLEPGTVSYHRCCSGSDAARSMLIDTPSFALFGQDLDPSSTTGSGTIWFDTTTIAGSRVAYFTWDGVAEQGQPGSSNTCQIQLWEDNRVVMCWNGVTDISHGTVVGWSAGGGAGQPPAGVDFSATPIDGGTGLSVRPLALGLASMLMSPAIGQPLELCIKDVPPGASSGALLLGSQLQQFDLDLIGMPDCDLLTSTDVATIPFATPAPPDANVSVPIANDAGMVGLLFHCQAAVLAPGTNPLGVVTSNGLAVELGERGTLVAVTGFGDYLTWFVAHNDGRRPDITSIQLDFVGSSNPAVQSKYFDTDEPLFGRRFDAGDSTVCPSVFDQQNVLDVGLEFANSMVSPCDPSARTGWTGTNPGANPGDWQTIEFEFTDFEFDELFGFSVDVDDAPDSPGDLAGVVVTITFANGSTLSGELQFATNELASAILH